MQAAENVIVLNEGEDVTKLDGLQDSTLKELLKYQGDSSAFDIDDENAILWRRVIFSRRVGRRLSAEWTEREQPRRCE